MSGSSRPGVQSSGEGFSMNLYFRLIAVLLRSLFSHRIGLLEESRIRFRVWPFDCDVNLHLTNARYFALCDLSRIYYMGQVGVLFRLIKRKWLPIAQAQEISYLRPINPLERFEVRTLFTHWDDKYWYTEHRFFAKDRLCAILQVRGVFVHGRQIVPMPEILALTGQDVALPEKPVNVEHWQKLINAKKES
jgi:acyl-CoA thioesterase FadM